MPDRRATGHHQRRESGWPPRQKFGFPTYGNNITGPDPVPPEELTTPYLTLEGENCRAIAFMKKYIAALFPDANKGK
jgi:hypothetical protein